MFYEMKPGIVNRGPKTAMVKQSENTTRVCQPAQKWIV